MRTICLLSADWNFGNKLLSRRIMAQEEQANTIALEQYGSRKNKSSIGHATNKAILYDIQRQKKQDSALLILDAKACYDRIPLHLCISLPLVSRSPYIRNTFYDETYKVHETHSKDYIRGVKNIIQSQRTKRIPRHSTR
jgi:hypothetical protein